MHLPFKKTFLITILMASISNSYSIEKTVDGSFIPSETADTINDKIKKLENDTNVRKYTINGQDDIDSSREQNDGVYTDWSSYYAFPVQHQDTLVYLNESTGQYGDFSAGAKTNESENLKNLNLVINKKEIEMLNGVNGAYSPDYDATNGNVYIVDHGGILISGGYGGYGIMGTFSDSEESSNGNVYIATDGHIDASDTYGIIGSASARGNSFNGSVYIISGKIKVINNEDYLSQFGIIGTYGSGGRAEKGNVYIFGGDINTKGISGSYIGLPYGYDKNTKLISQGNVFLFTNVNIKNENSDNVEIYGGYSSYKFKDNSEEFNDKNLNYNIFNDNLFSIASNPITLGKVGNFKQYNFYVNQYNKDVINNSNKAILTVTDTIQNSDTFDNGEITQNKSIVKLVGISKDLAESVKQNDEITLIDASNVENFERTFEDEKTTKISDLFETENGSTSTVEVGLGGKAEVTYNIDNENKKISVTIDKYDAANKQVVNKNIRPLAEGRLATLENVVRSAESLQDVMGKNKEVGTFTPIAEISGGINQYDGNTSIESRDYRLMVGSRYQVLNNLYTGIALDYGKGNYDSNNGDKRGEGNIYNYGASIFGKYTNSIGLSDLYFDGALRAGRTSTEMQSNYVIPGSDKSINYKSKSNYFGINAGTGFIYNLNETSSFDTSAHYFWTYLGSDNVTVENEEVYFKGANSSKAQLKEQYSYKTKNNLTFTLAGIYEYEFNSNSGASLSGTSVDVPNVKGSTKIIELGIKGTPIAKSKDFNFNLKFRGYSGKRNGASGTAFFEYKF